MLFSVWVKLRNFAETEWKSLRLRLERKVEDGKETYI